jgi:hypothetical protein
MQLLAAAESLPAALASTSSMLPGSPVLKPTPGEEQALRERVQRCRLRVRAELGEHAVNMGAELLIRHLTAAVTHQQQAGLAGTFRARHINQTYAYDSPGRERQEDNRRLDLI